VTRVDPLTRRAYAPVAVRSGVEIEPVGQGLRPPAARQPKELRRPSPEGDGARRERGDCSSCSRGNAIDRIGEPLGMKSRVSVRRVVGKSKATRRRSPSESTGISSRKVRRGLLGSRERLRQEGLSAGVPAPGGVEVSAAWALVLRRCAEREPARRRSSERQGVRGRHPARASRPEARSVSAGRAQPGASRSSQGIRRDRRSQVPFSGTPADAALQRSTRWLDANLSRIPTRGGARLGAAIRSEDRTLTLRTDCESQIPLAACGEDRKPGPGTCGSSSRSLNRSSAESLGRKKWSPGSSRAVPRLSNGRIERSSFRR